LQSSLNAVEPKTLSFQSDIEAQSRVSIKIPAMDLKGLGLNDLDFSTKESSKDALVKIEAAMKMVENQVVRLSSFGNNLQGFIDAMDSKKDAFNNINDAINKADIMLASQDMSNASQQMSVAVSIFGTTLRTKAKLTQLVEAAANAG
jgi:flagellin-like hook-associated protein FlgL